MSSSDSDDDYYANIAQKLEKIKNTFVKEKAESVVLNDSSELDKTNETVSKTDENTSEIVVEDSNTTVNSIDNDELTLDAIIANNTKAKFKRGRGGKRKTTSDTSEPAERETRSSKRKTTNSTRGRSNSINTEVPEPAAAPVEQNTAITAQNSEPIEQTTSTAAATSTAAVSSTAAATSTSRRRGGSARGRGGSARGRWSWGRNRGRGRTRRDLWSIFDCMFESIGSNRPNSSQSAIYPTYSVGNTDEYPDQSDSQQLFSNKPVSNDIEVIEEDNDPLEDNEEMSVKVYWKNLEIFKFKIRKYQKLTQIFDYFTEKEGVSNDKLLFTYNDRILKIDDTPDSINYSIAKFIDGGIVNQNVTHLVKENSNDNVNNGIKLKFQCQDKKKPFETMLRPEDKLALAMMKCAEHMETPLEKLKFYFDGDLITGKNTPQDLELEGGECIDVKISS